MIKATSTISRRDAVLGFAGLLVVGLGACGRASNDGNQASKVSAEDASAPVQLAAMTVYRDPSCGCCKAWAEIAESAGYRVSLVDRNDMPAIKARLGVPEALLSCHTATVGNYVIEGHVPLEAVTRLSSEKPAGIRGISVAGMPRGSPGMEMPDGSKDPFQVTAFDGAGRMSVYGG